MDDDVGSKPEVIEIIARAIHSVSQQRSMSSFGWGEIEDSDRNNRRAEARGVVAALRASKLAIVSKQAN